MCQAVNESEDGIFRLPAGFGDDHFSAVTAEGFPEVFALQGDLGVVFDVVFVREGHRGAGEARCG